MRRLLVLLLLVAPLAACGGGGGDNAKAAYVKKASAVCADARTKADTVTTPSDAAGFAPAVEKLVGIGTEAQSKLAALTPPPDDAAELKSRVLDPFAELVTDGRAFADKVKAAGSDSTALLPLLSQRPTGQDINVDYLKSYGLQPCADLVLKLRNG